MGCPHPSDLTLCLGPVLPECFSDIPQPCLCSFLDGDSVVIWMQAAA